MTSFPRVLIVGYAGQLGVELQRSFSDAAGIICHDRDTVDLAVPDQVRAMVRSAAPDIILNAAAYTAVDRAETEPEEAMAVNARAPRILAEEALRSGALLVHYSTDYVYDGLKAGPWVETDEPNPLNVYGASKLAGDEAIQQVGGKYLIFRSSWIYGPYGHNFLLTMLRLCRERKSLDIVDDQFGAPTSSIELANATRAIVSGVLAGQFGVDSSWAGLYHMTCGGSVSWCGFARTIFTRAQALLEGKSPAVNPIPSSEYPTPARRPQNSVLSNEKLNACFGVRLATWEAALDEVVRRLTMAQRLA
ncbi:MAG: dTDP-4-dehydrorhamnose reductase [Terracidiphilus sp.]|jgi:dTDP-4-dehydrorhamnose reductase